MIEKLEYRKSTEENKDMSASQWDMHNKINQLIDAVNRLEKHLNEITNATAELTPSKEKGI